MGDTRDNGRGQDDNVSYTALQVEGVIRDIGIDIDQETNNDFLCYCPFHGNKRSPSFSVSKTSGKYICFTATCSVRGSLVELIKKITGKGEFPARRLIVQHKNSDGSSFVERLKKVIEPELNWKVWPQETLDRLYEDFWDWEPAVNYMFDRDFEEETLRDFKIGYSHKQNFVVVPMHNPAGQPVGIIGRRPDKEDKAFKNSPGLPTSKTLWNFHRARRQGDSVIICEASFDAMRVHQAGFPNVVACLGGNFSPYHAEQLDRTFNTIILMTDFDKKDKHMYLDCKKCKKQGSNLCKGHNPGRDLGAKIAENMKGKRVLWASYDDGIVYPNDAKDAGDMTDDEIRMCIKNKVSNFQYLKWKLY